MTVEISLSALQLLALVKASLWQKPVDELLFLKETTDWSEISRLALQQTVGILAFEATFTLPSDLRPPKEWIQKAFTFIEANRRTHLLIDGCLTEAVTRFRNKGIPAVLLKGQAYAHAYPRPDMRQCGDIDLYVGEDCYHQAYDAVKEFGWRREDSFFPKAKHYGCWLRGIRIELHRIAGQLPSRSADRRFQQWSQSQLRDSQAFLMFGNEEINIPTPVFDVVFVFLHLYHHFLNGGIGLRHICDWTMLLHAHAGKINPIELERKLKDFRLMRGWQLFAPIAVEHLGLPIEECPFYSSNNRTEADKVLEFIMKEGNFGRAKQKVTLRPEGYISGKLYSFMRHTARMSSKFLIDPNTISRTYCSYVIKGFTRVIKDLMNKDKI